MRYTPVLLILAALLLAGGPSPAGADLTASPVSHKKLVVGVVEDPPTTMKNDRGHWTGFNVDLWRYLALDLRLDYEFREMTFEELQKALGDGTIDLSIVALFETAERYGRFDFSSTVGAVRLAVAVLAERDPPSWLGFARIFLSWKVMKIVIAFIALLFAIGIILWWIERKENPDHFGGHPVQGIGSGAYWVSSALAAGTCYDIALKSFPARIIGLIWILVCALAFSAFTASLASSLFSYRQTIETYQESKLRTMRLGVMRGTLQESLARRVGARVALYDREPEALAALKAKQIDGLFIDEVALAYYAVKERETEIRIHPTDFKPRRYAFAFPKGSQIRRSIDFALVEIMERPEWETLANRYGLDTNLEAKQLSLGKRSHSLR